MAVVKQMILTHSLKLLHGYGMKTRKKIIIRAVLACLILSILIFLLDRIFMPKYITENPDGNVTAEFYAVKTPIDAAYFGSSTVYNAIPPDYLWHEFGIASYTRANASQTLWQSYYLMKDTIRHNKPELITLDVSFIKYGEDFYEEPSNRKTIDGMRFSVDKLRCARESMWKEESLYSYIFPVLRFHSRWQELKAEDLRYAIRRPAVTYDGFIMEFNEYGENDEYAPPVDEDRDFPEKSVLYLEKIIALCNKEEIPLLLMKTPTYVTNWYPSYDRKLSELVAGIEGVDYINFDIYEEELGIDRQKDYVDGGSHLNIKGAEKFSKAFGAYITEIYGLEDHRNDDRYSRYWNRQYERYDHDKKSGTDIL